MKNRLWEIGILGDHNPQALLDSLFYYVELHFALWGGDEHQRLRYKPIQIVLHEPPTGSNCLIYTEDIFKINQGGLLPFS